MGYYLLKGKVCAEISALAVEVLSLALAPSSAGCFFSELSSLPFFFFTAIEKSSYIHYGILRKTKEFAFKT